MSELNIQGIGGAGTPSGYPTAGRPSRAEGATFGETLKASLAQVNQQQLQADRAIEELALGRRSDLATTLVQVEKATLTFQLMVQVRNKLVEAYQEVMRMQV
jgi:flagellar hook-basal body complex protein FliE